MNKKINLKTIEKKLKKIGAPSKYRPEYCADIIAFFTRKAYTEKVKNRYTKMNRIIEDIVKIPCEFPYFEDWCFKIGISHVTMQRWVKTIPDFNSAYSHAKHLQKKLLNELVACGVYDRNYGQFMAVNITDMRLTHHVEQTVANSGSRFYLPVQTPPASTDGQLQAPAGLLGSGFNISDDKSEKVEGGVSPGTPAFPPNPIPLPTHADMEQTFPQVIDIEGVTDGNEG